MNDRAAGAGRPAPARARSGAVPDSEEGEADPSAAAAESVFHIQGMDCPDCTRHIQERLRRVDGVAEAEGNPLSRRLRVRYDGSALDAETLRSEIGKLGYAARDAEGVATETTGVWSSPPALRTWVAGATFAAGLLLAVLGAAPVVAAPAGRALTLPALLFTAAALVGGWNFFPKGLRSARVLSLDMNFLMTAAILGALAVGEYVEAGAIAVLFSFAELLERYAVDRARGSIEALMELAPDTAVRLEEGEEVTVSADALRAGDLVVVRPGARVPADGTVEEGASAVNEATITGESIPAEKAPGDEVFAGTINGEGWLRVRVERAADQTTFARILRLVEEAESRKAPAERFVERFARWYTPAVTAGAVALAAVPPLAFGAPFDTWFVRGLTLLVIACPCALVISTPVAVVSGITAAARHGVLIKGGVHLEAMGGVEVVAFDKTGTLTHGRPEVTDVLTLAAGSESEVLALAAAVEARSEHPLAAAVRRAAADTGVEPDPRPLEEFEVLRGRGVRGRLGGEEVRVGSEAALEVEGEAHPGIAELRDAGKTVVLVGRPGRPAGALAFADRPRHDAAAALRRLREAGVRRTVMLTGDDRRTARAIALELGVDEVHAELLPEHKVEHVRALTERHGAVAMVGDGVNDAPALAAATVGIAMGVAGSDAALETADIALMGDDLGRLAYLYRLSHSGRGVIRQNIGASLALKLGLAAGVPLGWVSLIVAVLVGDMGASLGVTANSLRLARLRP